MTDLQQELDRVTKQRDRLAVLLYVTLETALNGVAETSVTENWAITWPAVAAALESLDDDDLTQANSQSIIAATIIALEACE